MSFQFTHNSQNYNINACDIIEYNRNAEELNFYLNNTSIATINQFTSTDWSAFEITHKNNPTTPNHTQWLWFNKSAICMYDVALNFPNSTKYTLRKII